MRARESSGRSTGPPQIPTGEAMLVRILLDGGTAWRSTVARQIEPSLRSDPRVCRLLEALRSFEADPAADRDDFVGWLARNLDDDELTSLVAQIATAEAPELTDHTIRRQLAVTLTEQWRSQARRLTDAIRRAEESGDEDTIATLQDQLRALRSRRPEL